MKAINMIKNQGGLTKSNPNQVKPDLEKKRSLKRRLEEEEKEEGKLDPTIQLPSFIVPLTSFVRFRRKRGQQEVRSIPEIHRPHERPVKTRRLGGHSRGDGAAKLFQ